MTTTTVNPLVREAEASIQEIDRKIQEFFDRVNDVLSWVPDFLAHLIEPIRVAIDALNARLREFWDRIDQLRDQRGDSDRLKEVGGQWATRVGDVAADIAGTIGPERLRTNIEWTGRAAEAYRATVPAQVSGLNDVEDLADQMRSSLNDLANSIDALWMAVGFALAGFVVGIVAAIAAAITVVGLPAAVAALMAAAGAALALISATIIALNSHLDIIESEQAAIVQAMRDVGTRWAVADFRTMSDASVTDGDGSDWRINR
jgi:hypothetical protein